MTLSLEERAKAIVDYAWSRRTIEDPPLIDVAIEHLRAVEKDALERARDAIYAEVDRAVLGNGLNYNNGVSDGLMKAGGVVNIEIRNLANPRDEERADGP